MIILAFNLQLFATEKTEKATPKKRKDVREKGQVFKSVELSSAVLLLVLFAILRLLIPFMGNQFKIVFIKFLDIAQPIDAIFSIRGIQSLGLDLLINLALLALPLVLIALVIGLAINLWQVGFMFSMNSLVPKFDRINPIEGFKKMFSLRTLAELVKSTAKVIIIGIIAYGEYNLMIRSLPMLFDFTPGQSAAFIGNSVFNMSMNIGFGMLALSILDYVYQWWEYEKSLRMSKQEVKDEYKQMEGDPQIRTRIKEKQREFGLRRMMQEVPNADVVITNPTHYAVALKYDLSLNDAPLVIAKGKDKVALRMKDVASENKISIVERPPLARALYDSVKIGQSIPSNLFHAVAEVLAFVYSIKKEGQ